MSIQKKLDAVAYQANSINVARMLIALEIGKLTYDLNSAFLYPSKIQDSVKKIEAATKEIQVCCEYLMHMDMEE